MIQPQTQTAQYWGSDFVLDDSDIEQIYNHLLEVERPQTTDEISRVIISYRVTLESQKVERLLSGRTVYQPRNAFSVGDQLVFPALNFAHGEVTGLREGHNPQYGQFNVIQVDVDGNAREFAADYQATHPLNADDADPGISMAGVDIDDLYTLYGRTVSTQISDTLSAREEFVRLGQEWFVKALLADVNIGHLHLTEAVLEMSGGGPLSPEEILPHLDMDPSLDESVLSFSLNYSLLQDARFDEVAPKGAVSWYLRRLEPDGVRESPARLNYKSIPHDRALLSPQLLLLERELDDEWSDLETAASSESVGFTLLFPHRWAGTIPLSSRIRSILQLGTSARQRIVFIDEVENEEIEGWIVKEDRYIHGLADWYEKNGIPVGGFINLKPGDNPGVVIIGYDRRRAQREWIRLATAVDNRINFELMKRGIGCGYDDLLIVGTDVTAAIDALWRRAETNRRTVASLLAELFNTLSQLTPQNTVHAKTLYSAINMLRRVPPGPLFAELVRHPAFLPVGDHYWQFDRVRWQESNN
ncbi:MAG: hypothetical protein GY943_32955 [Chloroflexi bacterium]|nr:hypothetical protein [Chloroflexota bacterium]